MRIIRNLLDAIIYSSIITTSPTTNWRKTVPNCKSDYYSQKSNIRNEVYGNLSK